MSIIPYCSVKDQATMAVGWLGPCLEAFSHVREWGWERKCPKIQNHHQIPGQPLFFGYQTADEQNPAPVQKVIISRWLQGLKALNRIVVHQLEVFCNVFHLQFICPHWRLHGLLHGANGTIIYFLRLRTNAMPNSKQFKKVELIWTNASDPKAKRPLSKRLDFIRFGM